ncbi:hypothetical protein [Streptomyces zagrosensis]|uniref:Secreted protein n=1 Tax=Streptomyces zagrosensis TaxID=1042984 RepID=A0A7W9Q985_9ACTN|nr:hypothetical protein [Streptomyces zagrosensis]MBB5935886.1 hypothetical protein [Streptomyces zagrosensis]
MRISRKTGVLVSSAAITALALGSAGTAVALVEDESPARSVSAPKPSPAKTAAQSQLLNRTGNVLNPVSELVRDVLEAKGHKPSPAQLTQHTKAIDKALAVLLRGQTTPGKPATPAKPAKPGKQSVAQSGATNRPPVAERLRNQAIIDLKARVSTLVKAVKAGTPRTIVPAAQQTLTGAVNVATVVLLSGELPAPDLKGLPKLPKLPGTATTLPAEVHPAR